MSSPRSVGSRTRVAAGVVALGALAAWEVRRRLDRSDVQRDPEHARLNAPLEGRPSRVSSHDGTDLHARVFGPEHAATVVLVHGWTCTSRFWTRQIQDLSRDLRVVAFDLRGHGRSAAPRSGDYSIEALAGDLDAVLRSCLPPSERAIAVGHSLGAMTLVAWAGSHRDAVERRLAGAVLVNTGVGDLISESLVVRAPSGLDRLHQAVGRVLLSANVPIPKEPTPISSRVFRDVVLGPAATPAEVAFCERMVLECRRDVRAACGATLSRVDLRDSVAALTVPTVVMAGERDRLIPPPHSRRLADTLPHLAGHLELADVGHMAPVEAPGAVTEQVRELVRASAGAREGPTARIPA